MTAATAESGSIRYFLRGLAKQWPLLLGLLALAIPTCLMLARDVWPGDIGGHGPIVIATSIWLFSRCWGEMQAQRTEPAPALLWLSVAVSLLIYIFGRAFDFASLEVLGLYLTAVTMLYSLFGWGGIRIALFPLVYLAFIIPLPGWVMDQLTAPLRTFVSYVATTGLQWLGYPIVREGVAIYIAQYQLLVEDACSGMNSIVGLTAIALFYVYVMDRAHWRYATLLVIMVIPIAILVNLMRVITLILLTYYAGDGVAQGFMHLTTGMVLFVVALAMMFLLDITLRLLFWRSDEEEEHEQA